MEVKSVRKDKSDYDNSDPALFFFKVKGISSIMKSDKKSLITNVMNGTAGLAVACFLASKETLSDKQQLNEPKHRKVLMISMELVAGSWRSKLVVWFVFLCTL
ncbi:hypothetical protein CDAR_210881 [Caerostris darwini]|uniref:Uncharacterized protein n=1 Tax=Caerostris darwini TaxID=1538125 RepID=A0AAV4SFM0_9ARAC|nr:hypothetical protein CDAR_210881 [Caerostris darwini]